MKRKAANEPALRQKTGPAKRVPFWFHGAPEAIRTPDPNLRRVVLYPAELRARAPDYRRGIL